MTSKTDFLLWGFSEEETTSFYGLVLFQSSHSIVSAPKSSFSRGFYEQETLTSAYVGGTRDHLDDRWSFW